MRSLLAFAAAVLGSIALFVGVFSIVHRPLTTGDIPRLMAVQSAYARTLPSPKIVILAGSNGRYSHRCAAVTETAGLPCVNLSVAFGIGLDYVLAKAAPLLQPGDLLYMPLEYSQYRVSEATMRAGAQNPVMVRYDRERLWQLPLDRIVRAYGYFDLPFLFHGLTEMALDARGFQRRVSLDTISPQGDEFGHGADEAEAYRDFLALQGFDRTPIPQHTHAMEVLRAFLERQQALGVHAIGGWPTTPADSPMDDQSLRRVRALFTDTGHAFVELPQGSRYPRSCFLDSLYHLHEGCQLAHSRAVGERLRALAAAVERR